MVDSEADDLEVFFLCKGPPDDVVEVRNRCVGEEIDDGPSETPRARPADGFPINCDRSATNRAIRVNTHSLMGSPETEGLFCLPQAHDVRVPPIV